MNPPPTTFPDSERRDRLRLYRSENVGPVTFRELLARHGGAAAAALDALPRLAARGGRRRPLRLAAAGEAERELAVLDKLGARMMFDGEAGFPAPLAALADAPPLLAVLGHPHLLTGRCVGMVGARNASSNGRIMAETLARELGHAGFVVVSGLARGIDAAAHRGALAGGTVAAVAGGVDVAYPAENADLQDRIAREGAVISEMPPGVVPQARHFPRRNRLIAGLSLGVIVVEAALKSGSLITARLAGEAGRDVMAVPGSPLDARARGCLALLKDGAILVEGARDVIDALDRAATPDLFEKEVPDALAPSSASLDEAAIDAARSQVSRALGPVPTPLDRVIRDTGLPPAILRAALVELELAGAVERHAGNRVALSPHALSGMGDAKELPEIS